MVKFAAALSLLLGMASASPLATNQTNSKILAKRSTSFFYPNMDHSNSPRGYAPDLDGDFNYNIYKTVSSGADHDTLQNAINLDENGNKRRRMWLASQPRVVFLPSGTYEISDTLHLKTDTILMGDPTDPPVIRAASNFGQNVLLDGRDPDVGGSGEQSFSVGLKNIILDTTAVDGSRDLTALHWGVAQGAQLQNVKITMASSQGGNGHTGIRLDQGSTLGLSDVRIERGQYGIHQNGHQQALYKNIYFFENTVGFLFSGGSTATLLSPTWETVGTGVLHTGDRPFIGIIDGTSINSGVTYRSTQDNHANFLIENLTKDTGSPIAVIPSNPNLLPSQPHVDTFTHGNTVGSNPVFTTKMTSNKRPEVLAPGGKYPVVAAPNFAKNTVADFINVKDPKQNGGRTVKGDNSVDEAGVLNDILALAAKNNKIAYFPFGKYRVESTLFVPPGSRIVGEGWATITGAGDFFKHEDDPKPVVSVGRDGDVGLAQIQDMRFTINEVLPGAIIVQFNMAGNKPGDVALWNSLVTVGGTRGADSLSNDCQNPGDDCKAAFLGIHLTKSSSAYIENVWNWVADHDVEENGDGTNIAAKGGVLVESTKGTWLHALGSEHWWLYQLNFNRAENVVVSMLQSETNYEQGDQAQTVPPHPWNPDTGRWNDPDFSHCKQQDTRCRMGFGNYITGGKNIYHYTSASWAFYSGWHYKSCANNNNDCQSK